MVITESGTYFVTILMMNLTQTIPHTSPANDKQTTIKKILSFCRSALILSNFDHFISVYSPNFLCI